jgi:hypothetical protein
MTLSQAEAVAAARRLIATLQTQLPYPVGDTPIHSHFSQDIELSEKHLNGAIIGREFWTLEFYYQTPPRIMADPCGIRIYVDAKNGNAALHHRAR